MSNKRRQSGLTLVEVTVVVVVIAVLTSLSMPAIRGLIGSIASRGSEKSMIAAALAAGRAIAAEKQRYAGVRFQQDSDGNQYMILIVNEEPKKMNGLTVGFRAVEKQKPVKLPENIGVMDMRLGVGNKEIVLDADISLDWQFTDTTTFSIIFSPSGTLVIHDVRVRNKDGVYQPDNDGGTDKVSMDDIFNSPYNIANYQIGMFIQDDYAALGLVQETSRREFVIYDKDELGKAGAGNRWSGYLVGLKVIHINPYTGRIISGR